MKSAIAILVLALVATWALLVVNYQAHRQVELTESEAARIAELENCAELQMIYRTNNWEPPGLLYMDNPPPNEPARRAAEEQRRREYVERYRQRPQTADAYRRASDARMTELSCKVRYWEGQAPIPDTSWDERKP